MTHKPAHIQCGFCKHFNFPKKIFDSRTCRAFPEGIPNEILNNLFDHREPYDGDNGIRFSECSDEEMQERIPRYTQSDIEYEKGRTMQMMDYAKPHNSSGEKFLDNIDE